MYNAARLLVPLPPSVHLPPEFSRLYYVLHATSLIQHAMFPNAEDRHVPNDYTELLSARVTGLEAASQKPPTVITPPVAVSTHTTLPPLGRFGVAPGLQFLQDEPQSVQRCPLRSHTPKSRRGNRAHYRLCDIAAYRRKRHSYVLRYGLRRHKILGETHTGILRPTKPNE